MDLKYQKNRWIPLSLIISYAVFAGASYPFFHDTTAGLIGASPHAGRLIFMVDGTYITLTLLLVALLGVWLLRLIHSYEKNLQESEARFRGLIESTPDMVWESNDRFEYTLVNPMSSRILGYSPEEMLGKTPFDFMPDELRDSCRALFAKAAEEQRPIRFFEVKMQQCGNGAVIVEMHATPILDEQGTVIGYRGIDRDITERRQAESVLVQTNDFYRMLFDNLPVALWRADTDGRIRYLNTAAKELLAMPLDELANFYEAIHPDDREAYVEAYKHAIASRTQFSLTYRLQKDQDYIQMVSVGVPWVDNGGAYIGFIGYLSEQAMTPALS